MAQAVVCSADEQRSWEIRQALADCEVEVDRTFQSSRALLAALAEEGDQAADILVVDESSSPMPMWDLVAEVSGRYPSIAVLTVVQNPSSEDFSTALDAGSRGIIAYPLSFENVASRVQAASSWSASLRKVVRQGQEGVDALGAGKMIAVASAKGGAGSSTVALHLALESAQASGRKVALVDLDLQKPDLSVLLDAPRQRDITDLMSVVDELSARFIADVLFEHPSGVSVLFGPSEGEQGETITEAMAKKVLGVLRSRFDVVVLDVGSVMGEANATAVEMADEVAVVSQANVLSLRGVRRLASLWERIGACRSEGVKVVLNAVHKTNDVQPESARKIVGLQTYRTVLPRMDRALEQAVNRRDPDVAGSDWAHKVQELGREMQIVPPASLARSTGAKKSRNRFRPRRGSADISATEESPAQEDVVDEAPEPVESERYDAELPTRMSIRGQRESGQVTVELMGVVMLFVFVAVLAFQLVLMGTTWIFAAHSANEGARAAATGDSAVEAAENATPGAWQSGMEVHDTGGRVEVSLQSPALVPATEEYILPIGASAGVLREP